MSEVKLYKSAYPGSMFETDRRDIGYVEACDYDALAAELTEAHAHEGAKDAQITELLAYLHFDESTGAHRDWVADCQSLEAENARLRKFLTDEREQLMISIRGLTHWDGCHKVHRNCARVREIDAALAAGSGE